MRQSASVASNGQPHPHTGSGKTTGGSDQAYRQAMARLVQQHNAYVSLSNAALTSHVGTMNMIAIMGGSPYRYSVR